MVVLSPHFFFISCRLKMLMISQSESLHRMANLNFRFFMPLYTLIQ